MLIIFKYNVKYKVLSKYKRNTIVQKVNEYYSLLRSVKYCSITTLGLLEKLLKYEIRN